MFFYILHEIVGASHYPGYNPMHQAVSDLTATAQEKEKGKAMLSSIDLTNKKISVLLLNM